jgi:ClpP class serine protease
MPNWTEVLQEIHQVQANAINAADQQQFLAQPIHCINTVRRGYLQKLHAKSDRNVIAYYSGFLSKPGISGIEINDEDKNGFMMAIHKLDRNKGLDIILHTPGGGITSTQSIVDYIHKMFRLNKNSAPDT